MNITASGRRPLHKRVSRAEKLSRVRDLRDAAMVLIQKFGVIEMTGNFRCSAWPATVPGALGDVAILLRTPFSGMPLDPAPWMVKRYATQGGPLPSKLTLPNGLDVWVNAPELINGRLGKVLNLEWDDKPPETVTLVTFRRGAWEERLLALAADACGAI